MQTRVRHGFERQPGVILSKNKIITKIILSSSNTKFKLLQYTISLPFNLIAITKKFKAGRFLPYLDPS